MKIGLVGGSMKPVHKGHFKLIKRASSENDNVLLFVSLSDRTDKNGLTITGSDMREVWERYLINLLPPNVKIEFVQNPVKKMYEVMGNANELKSIDTFTIYADTHDMNERFNDEKLSKYMNELYKHGQLNRCPIERTDDMDVSGTQMRSLLKHGMKDAFISLLPESVDAQGVWEFLLLRVFIRS